MKTYAPKYYQQFHCIADKCKHSCCIGWDVYLDEETEGKYANLQGDLGASIRACLCEKEDGICFEMTPEGKCPFLNEKGLCKIILEKGEDYISEICREHPRFYHSFSDRWEVGLGLSCEEAARIILAYDGDHSLCIITEDDTPEESLFPEEQEVLEKRARIFELLSDRSQTLSRRIESILSLCEAKLPQKTVSEWADLLSSLERLDPAWDNELSILKKQRDILDVSPLSSMFGEDFVFSSPLDSKNQQNKSNNSPQCISRAFENLLAYFLFRHTSEAIDEQDLAARVAFSVFSLLIICKLYEQHATNGRVDFDALCELCRLYSSEIEYSEENTSILIDAMLQ